MYSFRGSKEEAAQKKQAGQELFVEPKKGEDSKKPPEPPVPEPAANANPFFDPSNNAGQGEDKGVAVDPEQKVDILDMIGLNKPAERKEKRQVIPGSPNFVLMKKKPKKSMGEGKMNPLDKMAKLNSEMAAREHEAAAARQAPVPASVPTPAPTETKPINLTSTTDNAVAIPSLAATEAKEAAVDKTKGLKELKLDAIYHSPKSGPVCCASDNSRDVKSMLASCNCVIF